MVWNKEEEKLWSPEELVCPHEQADKGQKVQAMFNAIARRYDLANSVISFGQAGRWRKALADMIVSDPQIDPRVILDLGCGTGAMMDVLSRKFPQARVHGADFAVQMLQQVEKTRPCVAADAMRLPFCENSFDLITCTFGVRNFQSLETGMREIYRVLRPGGLFAVLEFQPPANRILGPLFNIYFHRILPLLGSAVTLSFRTRAYRYLPQSVKSWYNGNLVLKLMQESGFRRVRVRTLCLGVVWAFTAVK